MAKRFRKQISRALKRRFQQYEKILRATSSEITSECSKTMTLSYNKFADSVQDIVKRIAVLVCVCVLVFIGLALSSCNVTRKVTTESAFYQRGDTTFQIVTKTTESYDATKRLPQ